MRVLIVDQSRAMRAMLNSIMTDLRFAVLEAADGREALNVMAANPGIDLVLVDWAMSDMPGMEFVRTLRCDGVNSEVKVMMVTAEKDVAKMARVLVLGPQECAMRPLTRDAIVDKLEMLGLVAV